jgi:PAS domain S-box-containing protein
VELAILRYELDLLGLAGTALGGMAALAFWLCRRTGAGVGWKPWAVVAVILAASGVLAVFAQGQERAELERQVAGLAPTYAEELMRLGYEKVSIDTAAEDPVYLALIDAEVRWLRNNPGVADIYTYGRRPDGKVVMMVDSETDYDGDGVIRGEREERTAIGEPYEEDGEMVARAFAGERLFAPEPTADRWGVWISSYVPLKTAAGAVIGVLGVDFPARDWIRGQLWARGAMLGLGAVVTIIYMSALTITTLLRAEVARRRRTEEALRASETRLRTIVDNEPECVMVVDPGGRVLEINPAGLRLLEAEAAAVLGRPLSDFVDPRQHTALAAHHAEAMAGRGGMMEFEFVGRNGGHLRAWMETHSVPLYDGGGRVMSVLSVARDVTRRKEAEREREALHDQLVIASRRAGMAEIATGVLHNVGNALNSVNVSAAVVAEKLGGTEAEELVKAATLLRDHAADLPAFLTRDEVGRHLPAYVEALADCVSAGQKAMSEEMAHLSRGIEHIKEIVRAQQEHSKGGVLPVPTRPAALVEQALEMSRLPLETAGVTVERELEEIPDLPLDRHKVLQILVNLLTNAAQAVTGRTGSAVPRVTVRLRRAGDRLAVEVADNGKGIAPEKLGHIFEHGFTTRVEGHGFGLHSAANAAAEMGGRIVAASDGEGCGARFTLELPAGAHQEEARR